AVDGLGEDPHARVMVEHGAQRSRADDLAAEQGAVEPVEVGRARDQSAAAVQVERGVGAVGVDVDAGVRGFVVLVGGGGGGGRGWGGAGGGAGPVGGSRRGGGSGRAAGSSAGGDRRRLGAAR